MNADYRPGDFRAYFLTKRCEQGSVACSHTSINAPRGRYLIKPEDEDAFYALYTKALAYGETLHLTEKQGEWSPVRVDLDLRFVAPPPSGPGEERLPPARMYTQEHITAIVAAYCRLLHEHLHLPSPEHLDAYVMEKPAPIEVHPVIKDGIHIIFPRCVTKSPFQFYLREKVLQVLPAILADLPLSNSVGDVVDDKIIELSNWQLYGSRKPNLTAYTLSNVFRYDAETDLVRNLPLPDLRDVAVIRMLAIRGRTEADATPLADGPPGVEAREWIQRIYPTVANRKRDALNQQVFSNSRNRSRNQVPDDELMMVKKLTLECLSAERAEAYDTWVRVGWALRNIDHRLLETWIQFSKLSSKFVEGICEQKWDKMRQDGTLGVGSIRYWARRDSTTAYQRVLDDSLSVLLDRCLRSKGAHFDVATLVHYIFKDQFVSCGNKRWFYFDKDRHRWQANSEGTKLRVALSREVYAKFMERATYYGTLQRENARVAAENDAQAGIAPEPAGPTNDDNATVLGNIAKKLKESGYKTSVMIEAETLMKDECFEEKLDSKAHLMAFKNGVYDFAIREFRDGQPDDYISFSTEINYEPYKESMPYVEDIRNFFRTVHRNPRVEKFQWDILSAALDGTAKSEKFYIMTGSGCHAPGTLVRMFDGSLKKVEDVDVGERLMGDDSTPRDVLQLFRGVDDMYRIVPNKGDPFVVNGGHRLALKVSNVTYVRNVASKGVWLTSWGERDDDRIFRKVTLTFPTEIAARAHAELVKAKPTYLAKGDVVVLTVDKYLQNLKHVKDTLYLYKEGIDCYPARPVHYDPHMIGIWLGDGTTAGCEVTTMDAEIVDYIKLTIGADHEMVEYEKKGRATRYNIKSVEGGKGNNKFRNALNAYGLIGNKHIPRDYIVNSREVRLALLAGLIDTDGHYQAAMGQFEITLKSEAIIDGAIEIARSLGFMAFKHQIQKKCCNSPTQAVGTYYRTNIFGSGMEEIPVLLAYKKAAARDVVQSNKKYPTITGFKVEPADRGPFYGFELSGNHRYLGADFTVYVNSNGKSKLTELVQKAFGGYACVLPVTVLTSKRVQTGGVSPELVRIKGKRFVISQEPGENERLSVGVMKEITGGDDITARALYKDTVQFKPQCKLYLACNELPSVGGVDDGGTWRRIRIINFDTKFVVEPDPTHPNELPLDPDLMQKFPMWAETFMSMLIAHFAEIDPGKVFDPPEVICATDKYKMSNDLMGQFIAETIKADATCKQPLLIMPFHKELKMWWSSMSKSTCPSMPIVKELMARKLGPYPEKGWRGFRFAAPSKQVAEEEEDAEDAEAEGRVA